MAAGTATPWTPLRLVARGDRSGHGPGGDRLAGRTEQKEPDMVSKAQEAAQATEQVAEGADVETLVDTAAITRSEDVEQDECYTF
jgi:hypothetical protein